MSAEVGRVAIVGGSMAGLFAGVFLRSRGWRVDIYERGEELADRGAGIVTHDLLYNALRAAGVTLRPDMGVPSTGRMMLGRDGAVVGTYDMPQVMSSWGLVYRFLREQLPDDAYHNGHVLIDLEQGAENATAIFSNGVRVEADWVIGADGAQSTLRKLLAPEVATHYCGYFIWRGLIAETLIPDVVLAGGGRQTGVWDGAGRALARLPRRGTRGRARAGTASLQLGLVSERR